ncbi:acetylornithine deacetylase/succinyldiaminopimelate desuccinylase-like deacylase [Herbaspirillum sp. CF444]|uniref:M20/M25/M40 family metallo-hydrolase n=1 Tax=Herbaspirillum sp. CF444 TaxID=1144319 RepID=UPI000272792C|nr:M20/M25/M40 family metallo-hydrolase [Herbaspirillum sp. CF444]EJL88607.1 acetylornithine deacetylase/succinyldiaminopimelate desuccinylase-like deacylase [Herbaspirillum sp. CF444]
MSSSFASLHSLVTSFLDKEHDAQTRFLQELVRVPSDNPAGDCAAHGARAKQLLEELGFDVEAHAVPDALVKANGMISATNLIVRKRFGGGGPTIAMNAHGDVVPPGLGWSKDPYGGEIVQDAEHGPVMYGRGVAVSKSDFATYTWALLALIAAEKQGVALNGAIELQFTYDEEAGGDIGPKWILEQGLSKPDYAVSAGFAYGITSAHNGCLHLEVTVKGKQAHAAMPHTGIDAIEAATGILQALYAYRAELAKKKSRVTGINHATLNVGLIKGGINTNVVPDLAVFRLDRRMIPEEAGFDAEGDLRRVIDAAAAHYPGIEVGVQRTLLAEPLAALPGVEKLIGAFRRNAEAVLGEPVAAHGVPLYTDARHYTKQGIPTILYGAGPRTLMEARGHNSDENLRLDDLLKATKVVTLALGELLQ